MKETNRHWSILGIPLLFGCLSSAIGQTGVKFESDTDIKAYRVFNIFVEACIFPGSRGRQERINTIDAHPLLKRVKLPSDSNAAKQERLMWAAPSSDGVFIVLQTDLYCRAVLTEESIKKKIIEIVENTEFGSSDEIKRVKFEPINELTEEQIKEYQARNISIKQYVWLKRDTNVGIFLSVETSITPSPQTYPVRLSAIYVRDRQRAQKN